MRSNEKPKVDLDSKSILTTTGILLIAVNKLLSFVAFPSPSLYPDSKSYLSSGFLNFSQVSIFGNSTRPWPVTLIYSLLGDPTGIYLFQSTLSTLSWSVLLITCLKYYHRSKYFGAAQIGVVVLALTPQINQWDSVILATSFTISTIVLAISLLIRVHLARTGQLSDRFLLLFLTLLLGCLKISNFPLVFFLLVFLLITRKKIVSRKVQSLQVVLAIFVVMFIFIVGHNNNRNWSGSYSGTTLMWQLGQQSPVSSNFAEYLESKTDAPKCLILDAPFKDPGSSFNEKTQSCKGFIPYLRNSISSDFLKFLISDPNALIRLFSIGAGAILSGAGSQYGNSASLIPKPISEMYFGSTNPTFLDLGISDQSTAASLLESTRSVWIFAPSISIVTLLVLFSLLSQLRRREKANSLLILGILVMVTEITVTVIFLPSEWFRQTVPFLLGVFILSLILLMDSSKMHESHEYLE